MADHFIEFEERAPKEGVLMRFVTHLNAILISVR